MDFRCIVPRVCEAVRVRKASREDQRLLRHSARLLKIPKIPEHAGLIGETGYPWVLPVDERLRVVPFGIVKLDCSLEMLAGLN
jgi:hypothetical protein